MRGPEGRIEDFLRDHFKARGWLVYKMDQGGGVADRLLVSPTGLHLWVELKKPGKTELDPAQVAWAKDMRRRCLERSGIAIVGPVNCRDDVRALYERYQHG